MTHQHSITSTTNSTTTTANNNIMNMSMNDMGYTRAHMCLYTFFRTSVRSTRKRTVRTEVPRVTQRWARAYLPSCLRAHAAQGYWCL